MSRAITPRRPLALALILAAAAALALTACGSSSGSSGGGTSTSSSQATGGGTTGTVATIPEADRSPVGTAGTAPTVTVPSGSPPSTLQSADLIEGTGATAENGKSVTVQYVLATYSSGKVIQSSWTSQPFTFTLGAGEVIPGWDEGVAGMKVGGRRELIIPPNLGYGAQSPGAGIAANDTLVFVIDLLQVH